MTDNPSLKCLAKTGTCELRTPNICRVENPTSVRGDPQARCLDESVR